MAAREIAHANGLGLILLDYGVDEPFNTAAIPKPRSVDPDPTPCEHLRLQGFISGNEPRYRPGPPFAVTLDFDRDGELWIYGRFIRPRIRYRIDE